MGPVRRIKGMIMNRWLWLVYSVFGFCIPSFAVSEFVPIQEKAQGQSLGGSPTNNDSLYSNPAGSVFSSVYSLEGTYDLPRTFAVSILDTKTSVVGGGLGYFRMKTDNPDLTLQGAKLALSGKLASQIGIGVAGKMLWGPDLTNNQNTKMTDADFGVLTNFDVLQLGLTLRNAFGGNDGMGFSREFVLGGRINYEQTMFFSAAATALASNLSPYQYGFGVEYVSPYYFSIKGGFRLLSSTGQNYWSGGVSLLAPKLAVHYAIEFPTIDKPMEHTLSVALML